MRLPIRAVRINYRVLTTLLILLVPALAVAGLVVIGVGQASLRDAYGRLLERAAERTAASVDTFVFRRVQDVAVLTRVPTLRLVAAAGSAQTPDPEVVRRIDRQWQRLPEVPPEAGNVLTNPASQFLRDVVTYDPVYLPRDTSDGQPWSARRGLWLHDRL